MWLWVLCNDSMAPGLMHILFVHSDGFVIKEFNSLLPSVKGKRGREGQTGLSGTSRDNSRWSSVLTPSSEER